MPDEVIIVDKEGNEHHFPAGMDPKKAAGIVRKSLGMPDVTVTPEKPPVVRGNPGGNIPIAGWQPKGTFDTTEEDTTAGKIAQTLSLASVDPLTGLGAPVDAMGAGARTTAKVLSKIPFRSVAGGAAKAGGAVLDVPAAVLDNPVTGMFSPRLRNLGEFIGKGADALRGFGRYIAKEPPVSGGILPRLVKTPKPAGTVEDQLTSILQEGMLEDARPVSVEIPPSTTMTPDGVPARPSGGPVNPHSAQPGPSRPAPAPNAYSSGSMRDANMQGPTRTPRVDTPAAPPEVGVLTGNKVSDPLADMLNSLMSEQGAAPKSVELPPQPNMTATGRPAVTPAEYASADPVLSQTGRETGAPLSSYAPEPPAPAEVGTLTGRMAPAPEDELNAVLTDMLSPQGPEAVSLPSAPEGTAGGRFTQSGKFGKSGNKGQAGGYSSGQPPVSDTTPMEGWQGYTRSGDSLEKARNAYSSGDVTDPMMVADPADMGLGDNPLPLPDDSGAGATASSPVSSLTETPDVAPAAAATPRVTSEMAQQARSFLGSRDAARALGITENELKELAPGPSRRPGIVGEVEAGGNRGELTAAFLKELGIE